MPASALTNPSILDFIKRVDKTGDSIEKDILEALDETNEGILSVLPAVEANGLTSHRVTIRNGHPKTTFRRFYQGIEDSKSDTTQVDETMGMLRSASTIDYDEFKLNGLGADYRLTEDWAHVQVMHQDFIGALISADDGTNPEKFNGLRPRYNTLCPADESTIDGDLIPFTARNVISGGGVNGQSLNDIFLVVGGPKTVFTIFPKGSKAGLTIDADKEPHYEFDASNKKYKAITTTYGWNGGLCVRDWRAVVRIANVNEAMSSSADFKALVDKLIEAEELLDNIGAGRPFIMTSRKVRTALRKAAVDRVSGNLTFDDFMGRKMTQWNGMPIYRVDAMKPYTTALV